MAPCPVPFSITLTTVIGKHCKANSAQPRVAAGHTTVVKHCSAPHYHECRSRTDPVLGFKGPKQEAFAQDKSPELGAGCAWEWDVWKRRRMALSVTSYRSTLPKTYE